MYTNRSCSEKTTFSYSEEDKDMKYSGLSSQEGGRVLIIEQGNNRVSLSRSMVKRLPRFLDKWEIYSTSPLSDWIDRDRENAITNMGEEGQKTT